MINLKCNVNATLPEPAAGLSPSVAVRVITALIETGRAHSPCLSPHTASPSRCCGRSAPKPFSRSRPLFPAAAPEWRCTPGESYSPEIQTTHQDTHRRPTSVTPQLWALQESVKKLWLSSKSHRNVAGVDIIRAGIIVDVGQLHPR